MRYQLRGALYGLAVALTLAACVDQPAHEPPTAPNVRGPNLVVGGLPLTCDITALKAYSRDYAASNRDPLNTIISALQNEFNRRGIGDGTTSLAFDGLARLAVMRGNSGLQKSQAASQEAFDGLVKGFVACMRPEFQPAGFEENFAPAVGPEWLFEVLSTSGGVAYQTRTGTGNPYWSTQLITTPTRRFLVYGYLTAGTLPRSVGSEMEIRTIPTIASGLLAATFNISLCDIAPSLFKDELRLNHNKKIVALQTPACNRGAGLAAVTTPSTFARFNPVSLAQAALGFFGPKTLHAAMVQLAANGVSGHVNELSPNAIYDLSLITLTELDSIDDGQISADLAAETGGPVKIKALEGTTPREGIPVVMGILGNSSSVAYFTDALSDDPTLLRPTVTRLTESDGFARFTGVKLVKAGGYTLSMRVGIDNYLSPDVVTSNSFQIQGK